MPAMKARLTSIYRDYLACLNDQNWAGLGEFVHEKAIHDGKELGLSGYRAMLEKDFDEIPDLDFYAEILLCDPPFIGCRIVFKCSPKGRFFDLPINGKRVTFSEHVFYKFHEDKIIEVWSVIDKAAIEAQL
jgi:predicted ester cyclase